MTSVFRARLCLAHGKHPGNCETSRSLPGTLASSLSPHPKNEELTRLRHRGTEIIQGAHRRCPEEPENRIRKRKCLRNSLKDMILRNQTRQTKGHSTQASLFQGRKEAGVVPSGASSWPQVPRELPLVLCDQHWPHRGLSQTWAEYFLKKPCNSSRHTSSRRVAGRRKTGTIKGKTTL